MVLLSGLEPTFLLDHDSVTGFMSKGNSQDNRQLNQRIDDAVRPVLAQEGYDLIMVELLSGQPILRLYIENKDVSEGVNLDDCTRVSHLVSDLLDAEGLSDEVEGAFNLEVSSPGLDRPLARPKDFVRFRGRLVKICTSEAVSEDRARRRFTGTILEADKEAQGGIRLDVDGSTQGLPYEAILKARLVPEF